MKRVERVKELGAGTQNATQKVFQSWKRPSRRTKSRGAKGQGRGERTTEGKNLIVRRNCYPSVTRSDNLEINESIYLLKKNGMTTSPDRETQGKGGASVRGQLFLGNA